MIKEDGLAGLEKTIYEGMQRPEVEAIIPGGARRILDVGCGAGNLGAALKLRSTECEVTGIEMSPTLAELSRRRLDQVLVGKVEDQLDHLPDRYYDCAVFADVLEHMIDPHRVLASVRQKLEPRSGIVVASIPNVRHWMVLKELIWHGRWQYSERGLLDSGHLRFFTDHSIVTMFQWAGYTVQFADATIVAPRILWWLDRLLAGKVRPFTTYQYLLTARPDPAAAAEEGPWWARGPNL